MTTSVEAFLIKTKKPARRQVLLEILSKCFLVSTAGGSQLLTTGICHIFFKNARNYLKTLKTVTCANCRSWKN